MFSLFFWQGRKADNSGLHVWVIVILEYNRMWMQVGNLNIIH